MTLKIQAGNIKEMLGQMIPDDLPSTVDSGSPTVAYNELASDDLLETGVWSMTKGGFTIESYSVAESMVMLAGHLRMTDAEGDVTDLHKGDMFYIPKGWKGRWDVIEDMQKMYVIVY